MFDFIFEKNSEKKVDMDEKFTKFFGEEMNKRDVKQILVRSDAEFRLAQFQSFNSRIFSCTKLI